MALRNEGYYIQENDSFAITENESGYYTKSIYQSVIQRVGIIFAGGRVTAHTC